MSKRAFPWDEDAKRQPSSSVRILIVDDSEPWRRWLCAELGKHKGLRIVGEASDGLEAVKKAHELKPNLVLLDIGLPNLNGFEVANRLAQSTSESRVVFLTMHTDKEIVKRALSNGAGGFVLKKDALTDLLPAIAAVLEGRRFVSRSIGNKVSKSIGNKV
jgi:DNA-binding NarL/FixJ family response regulator